MLHQRTRELTSQNQPIQERGLQNPNFITLKLLPFKQSGVRASGSTGFLFSKFVEDIDTLVSETMPVNTANV